VNNERRPAGRTLGRPYEHRAITLGISLLKSFGVSWRKARIPAVQPPGYLSFDHRGPARYLAHIGYIHRPRTRSLVPQAHPDWSLRHCFLSAHLLRHSAKESDHFHDIYFRNPRTPIDAWTNRLVRLPKGDNPLYVTFPCRLPCLTSAASDSVAPSPESLF
jgi:hypothetical protein